MAAPKSGCSECPNREVAYRAASGERRTPPDLTTRRGFLCEAARALAAGLVVASVPPRTETLNVRSLSAPGQSMLAPFRGPDGAAVLIVREAASRYTALSLLCTHMGCPVSLPVRGLMTCPCHGAEFDLEGKVERGPAVYPLGRYRTTYHAAQGTVTVTLTIS